MLQVLGSAWALLLGMLFLMIGNGMQGTLLGVRGALEGFSTFEMSVVMSAYFLGFLGGSRLAPGMIRRVGHVRVFAALGSFISAILILYPTLTDPWAWALLRIAVGFCFSGVYVTAESWLNNAATNETRGQSLSLYMIVQMGGIVIAQGLLVLGDPSGFVLFVIPSVLVSLSFAPILLSINPTPAFDTTKPMSLRQLYNYSPLGCVGMFVMGGVFSAQFGMASVYATQIGMTVPQVASFMAAIYLGGMLLQYPIGYLSDRFDRRRLIFSAALIGGLSSLIGVYFGESYTVLLMVAFLLGGMSNPLYALLIAYTADYLEHEDMAAASGGLLFINGIGSVAGPLATGIVMEEIGPDGFWFFVSILMLAMAAYALWRMTRRPAPSADGGSAYVSILPSATAVSLEAAQEWVVEQDAEERADEREASRAASNL